MTPLFGPDLTQHSSGRVQAFAWEGIGIGPLPGDRNPAHAPIDWFETDYDDQFTDPDGPDIDPFISGDRDRRVP